MRRYCLILNSFPILPLYSDIIFALSQQGDSVLNLTGRLFCLINCHTLGISFSVNLRGFFISINKLLSSFSYLSYLCICISLTSCIYISIYIYVSIYMYLALRRLRNIVVQMAMDTNWSWKGMELVYLGQTLVMESN